MATGAIYSTLTGLIQQTISPPLSNQAQVDGLAANGLAQVIIPDGKNGGTGMIDLSTGEYADYAPQGAPIPNLWVQLTAAMVKSGAINAADLHPATVAEMNAVLTESSMATVATAKL